MICKDCPFGEYIENYYYDDNIQIHVTDYFYSCGIDGDLYEPNHECFFLKQFRRKEFNKW